MRRCHGDGHLTGVFIPISSALLMGDGKFAQILCFLTIRCSPVLSHDSLLSSVMWTYDGPYCLGKSGGVEQD